MLTRSTVRSNESVSFSAPSTAFSHVPPRCAYWSTSALASRSRQILSWSPLEAADSKSSTVLATRRWSPRNLLVEASLLLCAVQPATSTAATRASGGRERSTGTASLPTIPGNGRCRAPCRHRSPRARGRHVEGHVLRALRQQGGVHPRPLRRGGDRDHARDGAGVGRRGPRVLRG